MFIKFSANMLTFSIWIKVPNGFHILKTFVINSIFLQKLAVIFVDETQFCILLKCFVTRETNVV